MIIRRIGVWSAARIYGAILASMGLLFGACLALFSLVGLGLGGANGDVPRWLGPILGVGAAWWPLAMARELDDAILLLRTNELEIGTWIFKTSGDAAHVLAADSALQRHRSHWFVRETIGMLRRTLARLDVSSRSLFALIEPGSCFAGTLLELALAADRSYMLDLPDAEQVQRFRAFSTEDPAVLAEVESLLLAARASGGFLESPVFCPAEPESPAPLIGARPL